MVLLTKQVKRLDGILREAVPILSQNQEVWFLY